MEVCRGCSGHKHACIPEALGGYVLREGEKTNLKRVSLLGKNYLWSSKQGYDSLWTMRMEGDMPISWHGP